MDILDVNSSKFKSALCKMCIVKYKSTYRSYNHLVLGGTFDLLHKGHKSFLKSAFLNATKVTIGLTSDSMASKKGKLYQNYKTRRVEIVKYLNNNGFNNWQIVKINDLFGFAHEDITMDSILVSRETKSGAQKINNYRKRLGFKGLKILVIAQIMAEDGKKISSGRIKNGEINRDGTSFFEILTQADKFILPETLRSELAKPLGKLYKSVEEFLNKGSNYKKIFVVGDASVANFKRLGINPDLSIVDFMVQRKNTYNNIEQLGFKKDSKHQTVKSGPGEITRELATTIDKSFNNSVDLIKVDGEEDLAVLPLVLLAPLESCVIYGQRDQGFVCIDVREKTKEKFLKILELFEKSDN